MKIDIAMDIDMYMCVCPRMLFLHVAIVWVMYHMQDAYSCKLCTYRATQ